MQRPSRIGSARLDQRFTAALVIVLALAVFILTWVGIRQSRADSFELLVHQGKAFIEALAGAAESAIVSESFYNYLVHRRYAEVVVEVAEPELDGLTDQQLAIIAQAHSLFGLHVFSVDSALAAGSFVSGPRLTLPQFVIDEVNQLIASPENNYVLLLDQGERPGDAVHYYLEITNSLDRVILITADALYYVDALQQTQIGFLAQKMARERGVVYILYQSTEGIIFSSRETGPLLAIESDPFLSQALETDSISHRVYNFQDQNVLELVRPLATTEYPFGLLRVGLSLDGFYAVSRGFDRQMIALAAVLFVLAAVALLYVNTRQQRREIAHRYSRMKSITDRIFDEMRTGVAAVDKDGTITLANGAFRRIFGMQKSTGVPWNEAVPVAELAFDRVMVSLEASVETEVETDVSGAGRTLLVATSRLHDDTDRPGGMVAVVYDITRLKEYERKSARRERLSEMGNLAAGVAHEIRNPLNTISIASQRLAAEFSTSENAEEYLAITNQIRSETRRLNDIINRFLALAREERKGLVPVDMGSLVSRVTDFLKPEARQLGIELSVDVPPDLMLEADADALRQVFINLFNNTKEALSGRPGKLSIRATRQADTVEIRFSDSGPGVRPELREKIFTPYFTTKEAGTGLGLPTVHRIIAELGGDIRVTDSDLGGAMFVVTLPVR